MEMVDSTTATIESEVKEIAKIHGISAVTVRRHLSTARHKLREVVRALRLNTSATGLV